MRLKDEYQNNFPEIPGTQEIFEGRYHIVWQKHAQIGGHIIFPESSFFKNCKKQIAVRRQSYKPNKKTLKRTNIKDILHNDGGKIVQIQKYTNFLTGLLVLWFVSSNDSFSSSYNIVH